MERLDVLLVKKGLAPSRERAKDLIKNGQISVDQKIVTKASANIEESCTIDLIGEKLKYVSRGGLKLEKAIDCFNIDLNGKVCMDIGASTGGFTDCMLQNGATKVYAVDVGTDQLSPVLKNDSRVISMEQTNIRYLDPKKLGIERPDFISTDVSFISLTKVIPVIHELLNDNGYCVCLIKPQFEAGKAALSKKGVVRDSSVREKVVKDIKEFSEITGFSVLGTEVSPIKGPEGNVEYLIFMKKERYNG